MHMAIRMPSRSPPPSAQSVDGLANWEVPDLEADWEEDHAFARQFLRGTNPMSIYNVSVLGLPSPLKQSLKADRGLHNVLKKVFGGRHTLQSLQAEHRLYAADYQLLDNLTMRFDRYVYPASVLLWVDDNKVLQPAAIQLSRGANGGRPHQVFTPLPSHTKPIVWYARPCPLWFAV